jgi:CHAT domain-containing protein
VEASIRNFQIARTVELIDAGTFTSRLAVGVFAALLPDPTPADWTFQPLDTIAVLSTDHQAAFDRWFLASLDRKEIDKAVEIADFAKRRRFFAAQPLGGRLVALRHVLEAPEAALSRDALLQRKNLLQRFPEYAQLATDAHAMRQEINAALQFDPETGKLDPQAAQKVSDWSANAGRREALLTQIALRRETAEMAFPPHRPTAEIQKQLKPGQALVVFHQPGDTLFAFLVTSGGINAWQIEKAGQVKTRIGKLYREIANYNNQRTLSSAELTSGEWRTQAAELSEVLFALSKLDLNATNEIVIVPDGPVWLVPFEALPMASSAGEIMLSDAVPLRTVPTAGLAVGDAVPLRPVKTTGIALPTATPSNATAIDATWESLSTAVEHPVRISGPLSVESPLVGKLFDQLLVLVESDLAADFTAWSPLPLDRGGNIGALPNWLLLPYDAPERMLLTGVRMGIDLGQRSRRRNSTNRLVPSRDGDDLFQAACGLLSSGARTLLISRWQTGGAVQEGLVREFASEMDQVPAAEAWQRSIRLARAAPLDPAQEPRFRMTDDGAEMPTADHPFFWAGFVLFDTGRDPRAPDQEPQEERVVERSKPGAPPAEPMPGEAVRPPTPPQPASAQPANDSPDDELPALPPVPPLPDIDPPRGTPSPR